jgi:GAF domain-containing protein
MIKSLNRYFQTPEDNDPVFIRLTRNILIFTLFATLLPIAVVVAKPGESAPVTISVLIIAGMLELVALVLVLRGKIILARAIVPIALVVAITIIAFGAHSIHDISVVALPVVMIIATLLQGRRATAITLPFAVLAIITLGTLDMLGVTTSVVASRTGIDDILIGIILLVASSGILNLLIGRLNQAVETAQANELAQIEANTELRELQTSLEQRVSERTFDLEEANKRIEHRAKHFEAIALISGASTSIRSLEELLPRITHLISEHFGFYHAGIFLIDASNSYATLSAANSEGGKNMLARGHQLKIGEQGIVGDVASTGKPRIALDVGKDAIYFDNPDMPDTRSEMALPLVIGDRIVGVLDVQSTESAAFDEEDIQTMSILADQVSLAIENARLFEESSKSLAEAEVLYRQYLRQAWGRMPKEQRLEGYKYSAMGAVPIERIDTTNKNDKQTEKRNRPEIAVPIMLRGEPIGTLAVQVPETGLVNEDHMDMIKAVAERVAISAENARLFEETNRRAERERLVTAITAKIRSTNNPDVMIQTALDELKTALGATRVQLVPHDLETSEPEIDSQSPTQPVVNPSGNSKKSKKKSGGPK